MGPESPASTSSTVSKLSRKLDRASGSRASSSIFSWLSAPQGTSSPQARGIPDLGDFAVRVEQKDRRLGAGDDDGPAVSKKSNVAQVEGAAGVHRLGARAELREDDRAQLAERLIESGDPGEGAVGRALAVFSPPGTEHQQAVAVEVDIGDEFERRVTLQDRGGPSETDPFEKADRPGKRK